MKSPDAETFGQTLLRLVFCGSCIKFENKGVENVTYDIAIFIQEASPKDLIELKNGTKS